MWAYPQGGEIRQQPQPIVVTNTRHIPHLPDVRVIFFSVAPLQRRGRLSGPPLPENSMTTARTPYPEMSSTQAITAEDFVISLITSSKAVDGH